ncbi:MAG: hypothetical protein CMG71_05270 [Candidatus Marinimicrobia bacterium]|nr:hypothetical protein [Candidatus Neomarinimicrobiota bacterium]
MNGKSTRGTIPLFQFGHLPIFFLLLSSQSPYKNTAEKKNYQKEKKPEDIRHADLNPTTVTRMNRFKACVAKQTELAVLK